MTRKGKLYSTLAASFVVLAACDGSDGVLGNAQAQFGPMFAAAFNGTADDDAKDDPNLVITYGGVDGVDLNADPLDI